MHQTVYKDKAAQTEALWT